MNKSSLIQSLEIVSVNLHLMYACVARATNYMVKVRRNIVLTQFRRMRSRVCIAAVARDTHGVNVTLTGILTSNARTRRVQIDMMIVIVNLHGLSSLFRSKEGS